MKLPNFRRRAAGGSARCGCGCPLQERNGAASSCRSSANAKNSRKQKSLAGRESSGWTPCVCDVAQRTLMTPAVRSPWSGPALLMMNHACCDTTHHRLCHGRVLMIATRQYHCRPSPRVQEEIRWKVAADDPIRHLAPRTDLAFRVGVVFTRLLGRGREHETERLRLRREWSLLSPLSRRRPRPATRTSDDELYIQYWGETCSERAKTGEEAKLQNTRLSAVSRYARRGVVGCQRLGAGAGEVGAR